jgi:hypothetical protein
MPFFFPTIPMLQREYLPLEGQGTYLFLFDWCPPSPFQGKLE